MHPQTCTMLMQFYSFGASEPRRPTQPTVVVASGAVAGTLKSGKGHVHSDWRGAQVDSRRGRRGT